MKECKKCGVRVSAPRALCPLCQATLTGGEDGGYETFPDVPTVYRQWGLFLRILIFASAAACLISGAVNLLLPESGLWSLMVIGGVGCMWATILTAIFKRNSLYKNILYEVVVISALLSLWDLFTGWHGAVFAYVLPALCLSAALSILILATVKREKPADYVVYLLIDQIFGLVPVVLGLCGLLAVRWPAYIFFTVSFLLLLGVILFNGHDLVAELRRRLHM